MSILNRAELLLQAKNYSGSGDWLDESGNSHDAVFGTGTPGTNDPQILAHTGENYVYLPGTVDNGISTPLNAVFNISDLDLSIKFSPASANIGSIQLLIDAYNTNYGYRLSLLSGNIKLTCHIPGVALDAIESTAFTLVNDVDTVVRVTRDSATGIYTFYQDGVQIDQQTGSAGALSAPDIGPFVGRADTGVAPLSGRVYYAEIKELGGAVVGRFDAADAAEPFATQVGAVDGLTWTYSRSGSGLYVVDQPAFGLHTDNYFEVADHADLDFGTDTDFTLMVSARKAGAGATSRDIVSKGDLGAEEYYLLTVGGGEAPSFYQGPTAVRAVTGATLTGYTASVVVGRRDADTDFTIFVDGVEGTPAAASGQDLSNASPLYIGARISTTIQKFFGGEIMAVALFREALTDDEIVEAGEALLGGGLSTWILLGRRPAVHVGALR